MDLKLQVANAIEKVDGLSPRERVIILLTAVALMFGTYNQFVLDPFLKNRTTLKKEMAAIVPEMDAMQQTIASLVQRQARDPNVALRKMVVDKTAKVSALDITIDNETKRLIDPQKMPKILGYLLSRRSALTINSVKSTAGEPVMFDDEEKPMGLFTHGLEIELEGTYQQVKTYLGTIEALAEQVYWDDMVFEMQAYPIGTLKLNVHTMSTSPELIGVY